MTRVFEVVPNLIQLRSECPQNTKILANIHRSKKNTDICKIIKMPSKFTMLIFYSWRDCSSRVASKKSSALWPLFWSQRQALLFCACPSFCCHSFTARGVPGPFENGTFTGNMEIDILALAQLYTEYLRCQENGYIGLSDVRGFCFLQPGDWSWS